MSEFVGDRVKRLREARNLSQMALRRLSGLSQTTLYRAEVGGVVTRRTAQKLAPVFGCAPDDLLPAPRGEREGE